MRWRGGWRMGWRGRNDLHMGNFIADACPDALAWVGGGGMAERLDGMDFWEAESEMSDIRNITAIAGGGK